MQECESCEYYDGDNEVCEAFECNGLECSELPCEDDSLEDLSVLKQAEHTYKMSSLWKKETGLDYVIWLDPYGSDREKRDSLPRVKVEVCICNSRKLIPVILYPDGARLLKGKFIRYQSEVEKWVESRRDVITKHYNKEITDRQALILLGNDN